MKTFVKLLFSIGIPSSRGYSWLMLSARIIFGLLLLRHGIGKMINYSSLATTFPDPLHVGHEASLMLTIFAEVLCAAAVVVGFLYRLALLPMIFSMIVIVFMVDASAAFSTSELAFAYGAVYILMFLAGAGNYSVDWRIGRKLSNSK